MPLLTPGLPQDLLTPLQGSDLARSPQDRGQPQASEFTWPLLVGHRFPGNQWAWSQGPHNPMLGGPAPSSAGNWAAKPPESTGHFCSCPAVT